MRLGAGKCGRCGLRMTERDNVVTPSHDRTVLSALVCLVVVHWHEVEGQRHQTCHKFPTHLGRTMSKERRTKYHRPVQEGDKRCRSFLPATRLRRKGSVQDVQWQAKRRSVAVSSLRMLSSGGYRYPDRRPSEFV